jgi:multiple sugar transport system permease protein
MSTPVKYELHTRSLVERLFEPPSAGKMSPASKVVVYTLLAIWSVFVIFPIYWVVITSFKLPQHVDQGPVFLPFIDFWPSLHAWESLLVKDGADTLKSYMNSFIIGIASTALCVGIGSMAAYALARIQYKPRFGVIMMFVVLLVGATIVTGRLRCLWRSHFSCCWPAPSANISPHDWAMAISCSGSSRNVSCRPSSSSSRST